MRREDTVLGTMIRSLTLAGLSAGIALAAGGGGAVYAAAPGQTTLAEAATTAVAGPGETVAPAGQAQTAPAREADAVSAQGQPTAIAQASAQPGATKKKKVKQKKEKPPKLVPMHIAEGTLTVDGWTGKARLNYEIADLKYIYVWVPGIGTVVASNTKFPMAKEEPAAFNQNNLTLDADGHTLQISSESRLLKAKKPSSAWVYVDTSYRRGSGYPEMGYGSTRDAPYAWPGSRQNSVDKGAVEAPPLPAGLRPSLEKAGCAAPAAPTGATTGQPAAAPCPASAPAGKPAQTPPAPLPGYKTNATTAAQVSEVPVAVQ